MFDNWKMTLVPRDQALPGRDAPICPPLDHLVLGRPLQGPWPEGCETALFAMGCFWGAERLFWNIPGVWVTAVGYAGGYTPNPTYREVCSGLTGHAEAVRVVWRPEEVSFADLLAAFWEGHDPTQGMRQGNDVGTQYRSAIWCSTPEQLTEAEASREAYQDALWQAGRGDITTGIAASTPFYLAEAEHQQYLARNPGGYCGLGGCGVDYRTTR